jgi:hypothetical protein
MSLQLLHEQPIDQGTEWQEKPKGINPFGEFSCCVLKKCCKKYKKGKRCKKCPNR